MQRYLTEKALGPSHPNVATSLNFLALLWMKPINLHIAEELGVGRWPRMVLGASVLERDRGFADSPLEGSGFELLVPVTC